MLKLEPAKMQKAIERAKAEHLKVKVVNVCQRTYSVTGKSGETYTVRFAVANGHKFGECSCKGGQAGLYCKHLAAGAQANILCQAFRTHGAEVEPTVGQMFGFEARYGSGWCI
jgi:hypothetical protein